MTWQSQREQVRGQQAREETVTNSSVRRKKKLYGGCNALTLRAAEKNKNQRVCSDTIKKDLGLYIKKL